MMRKWHLLVALNIVPNLSASIRILALFLVDHARHSPSLFRRSTTCQELERCFDTDNNKLGCDSFGTCAGELADLAKGMDKRKGNGQQPSRPVSSMDTKDTMNRQGAQVAQSHSSQSPSTYLGNGGLLGNNSSQAMDTAEQWGQQVLNDINSQFDNHATASTTETKKHQASDQGPHDQLPDKERKSRFREDFGPGERGC